MKEPKFYICRKCGEVAVLLTDGGKDLAGMEELKAGTTEGAAEKHLPVAECSGGMVQVNVGSVMHPMSEEHYIDWVYLVTDRGAQVKYLSKSGEPKVCFALSEGEQAKTVYAYCNQHGLWKTDVK